MSVLADLAAAAETAHGIRYVEESGGDVTETFAALWLRARAIAGGLIARGVDRGEAVGVVGPGIFGFLGALLGVQAAGAVPVPLAPPFGATRWRAAASRILAGAGARVLVATAPTDAMAAPLVGEGLLRVVVTPEVLAEAAPHAVNTSGGSSAALYQYTSGSTSTPKGVVITWDNLRANLDAIVGPAGLAVRPGDRAVSWLPLYHDMGLIGMALAGIRARLPLVLMTPLLFLKRPSLWLETIAAERATISFAPNFAYALAARRVRDDMVARLDLSCWRVAGCGAEPIQAEALAAFARRFAPCGFRREAFLPAYGMAEHTLAATFAPVGRTPCVDRVDRVQLGEGRAEPAPDGVAVVSCGSPLPGHEVQIVDADGALLPERRVGEICLRGPSLSPGYLGDAPRPATAWFRTGDLGYFAAGELHVCGRLKDLVILHGRKYHPSDIEESAAAVAGVRLGGVVAFSAPGEASECLVIVAEVEPGTPTDAVERELRTCVQHQCGIVADTVVVTRGRVIPRTSSGKPQRGEVRAAYLAGRLPGSAPAARSKDSEGAP